MYWEENCHLFIEPLITWFAKQLRAHHAFDVYGDNYLDLMGEEIICFQEICMSFVFSTFFLNSTGTSNKIHIVYLSKFKSVSSLMTKYPLKVLVYIASLPTNILFHDIHVNLISYGHVMFLLFRSESVVVIDSFYGNKIANDKATYRSSFL